MSLVFDLGSGLKDIKLDKSIFAGAECFIVEPDEMLLDSVRCFSDQK